LIDRVSYFNEESGFAVLRVQVKNRREPVTVVGTMPAANAGEWLTAEGIWVRDKDHGLQLKATLLKSTPPSTREGIEKYLGSGMVKGIGPVYAKKLVHKFGETIFDIIENASARLQEVEGIGPGRRKKIKEAWAEQRHIRQIMVFLHSHGVSTAKAVRIFKTYGELAIEKVQQNPYVLAKDISGIGFKTADQIAQKLGIPPDSQLRARAGLSHILDEAASQGHCALPRAILIDQTLRLLDVKEEIPAAALLQMLQARELFLEHIRDEELVFLPKLKSAEESVAARVIELGSSDSGYPPIHLERALEWFEKKSGKSLSPSQVEALKKAFSTRALVITGGPGVGKTTLLEAILAIATAKKIKCLLCAPTGRAARRLSESTGLPAKTIHRLLEFQPGKGFLRNRNLPLEADLLVVDETSMVDISLMQSLMEAMPSNSNLLLVGDVDQLPSVGPGNVLRDIIESRVVPVVRLTEIFRQAAGSKIITNAHKVNSGFMPEMDRSDQISDFYFIEREQPEEILATLKDLIATRIPARFKVDPMKDIQALSPMNRGLLGIRELNLHLQSLLNPSKADAPFVEKFGWQFREGDRVIQTENDYQKEVFNGDIGAIKTIDPIEREITIDYEGREVIYDFGEMDQVSLGYAITIHKAQGSEFPVVVMPLAMQQYLLLQRNLIYTGLTRGKKLVVIIGQKKALATALRNNSATRRFGGLLARLESGEQI
jgi:exodeoxyribonuclease V alpha subunit